LRYHGFVLQEMQLASCLFSAMAGFIIELVSLSIFVSPVGLHMIALPHAYRRLESQSFQFLSCVFSANCVSCWSCVLQVCFNSIIPI
jgi:hypothetical protein